MSICWSFAMHGGRRVCVASRAWLPPRSMNGIAGMLTGLIGAAAGNRHDCVQQPAADPGGHRLQTGQHRGTNKAARRCVQGRTPMQGWDMAIEHHRCAIQLAPNEDFYYLWLGRALLEKARTHPNPANCNRPRLAKTTALTRSSTTTWPDWGKISGSKRCRCHPPGSASKICCNSAKIILEEARRINPLNTDHSANLGRMWLQTVDVVQDTDREGARFGKAIASMFRPPA